MQRQGIYEYPGHGWRASEVQLFFAITRFCCQEPLKDFESLAKDAFESIQPAIEAGDVF